MLKESYHASSQITGGWCLMDAKLGGWISQLADGHPSTWLGL